MTNDEQDQQRVQDAGLTTMRDYFPDQGPLAGLHAGLQGLEEHQTAVLLGCDLPFLRRQVLQDLIQELERDPELDAVVPCEGADGHLYPVCAVYRARVRPVAEENLRRGDNAMRRFLARIRVLYIPTERWAACSPDPFFNMNTPQDYQEACILWKREGSGDHE